MRVNKYQIRVPRGVTGSTINIPIQLTFLPVDQAEVVERDFVDKEIEKAINPVEDYEKVRFIPVDSEGSQIKHITYRINLLDGGTFPATTMYSHAGFVYDDVKFRKKRFTRSFLRLSFFDSDIPTNQNLVSFMTLFSRLTVNDIIPLEIGGVPVTGGGLPNPINQIPIRFLVEDPVEFPEGISEGYHIYHFKDEVDVNLPKELFMRASWNNAATGESIPLITDPTPQTIDNLVSKLHMKYILKRDLTGWYYEIDQTYSSPVNTNIAGDTQTIDLYQIQAL